MRPAKLALRCAGRRVRVRVRRGPLARFENRIARQFDRRTIASSRRAMTLLA